ISPCAAIDTLGFSPSPPYGQSGSDEERVAERRPSDRPSLNTRAMGSSSVLLLLALALAASSVSASPDADAKSLLAQMTLDEKIGQMVQVDSGALKDKSDVQKYFIGSVLSGGNSDPPDNRPETWLKFVNEIRAQALKTRLKIPLLYGVDAVHGHNNILGAVIFPHHIGMGAANDPALVEKAEQITAQELRATGINWAFAPCIAVARDIRWG